MRPRIILAVSDAERREAYLSALRDSAECTVGERLRDIPDLLRQGPYSGILIDINLKVKATYLERARVSDSLRTMPCAAVKYNPGNGLIKLLMLDNRYGTARSLEEFATLCAGFQPEPLFPENRDALHLNAVLSPDPEFGPEAEHTFTMYVSGGGCFLFTARAARYRAQDLVWVDFVGLADRSPVLGKVCWVCEWGVSHAVPGIHVSFESILESQHREIMSLLALRLN